MTDGDLPPARSIYAGVLVALLVASVLGLGVASSGSGGGVPTPDAPRSAYSVTEDGEKYLVHPSKLVQGCPGGRDCIPAIDDPQFQSAGQADWLHDSDLVVGLAVGGEVKAYPLRILAAHEIVNDRIGGRPVAVTYCPLCRSAIVFDRRVRGETLSFGVSGKLLHANLVMYDRQTGSYWSQLNGTAIVGPMVPTTLTMLPSTVTTWAKWRNAHPDTEVLSRNTGIYPKSAYSGDPYAAYANSSRVGFGVDDVDDRLPAKELVYGVTVGGGAKAYPADRVAAANVVNDEVNGVPIAIVENQHTGGVAVFVRRVDGETLTFHLREGELVDGHGNRWSFDGRALEGPHEGATLDRLHASAFYWFAWSSFHPGTAIYNGTG